MNGVKEFESDVDIDIASLFVSLWRNKGKILLGSLVAAGLAYGVSLTVTPKYMSSARIVIEPTESASTRPGDEKSDDKKLFDTEGVKSQVELVGSNEVLQTVADKNKLLLRSEFDPVKRMSSLDRALILLSLKNDPAMMDELERPVAVMREKLKIYVLENSRAIVVEFSSEDQGLAKLIPNAIAEEYMNIRKKAINQSNTTARDWLEPEIAKLQKSVRDKEAQVALFRSQSDLLQGQNNTSLASQRLSELSSELSRIQANRSNARAKAASVRAALESGGSIDNLPEVVSSNLIQRLRERQVQMQSEIAELSTTMLDGHPRIKAMRSQLANLQKQIASEGRNILLSLETEANNADARERAIIAELNTQKAESSRVGEEEVKLQALERDAMVERNLLEERQKSLAEANSRGNTYVPVDAYVIKAAKPQEPYFPKKIPIVGAAFAGSLLLLSLLTMVRELFSGRAFKPVNRMMREDEKVPALSMPQAAAEPESAEVKTEVKSTPADTSLMALAPVEPEAPAVDPEHTVKAMCDRLVEKGAARAVVVSPEGDEAAASSVLIARELADRGLRSILLDLTSTGAASNPMVDGLALPGITNLLSSTAQFRDIIQSDPYSGAHVIPNGTADAKLAMRAVERLPIILNALTTAYDIVIVECGPADAKGIARLITPGSEVIISVIDPADASIVKCAAALADAGYEDLLIVTPVGSVPTSPGEGRYVA